MIDVDKFGKVKNPTRIAAINKIDKIGVIRYHDTFKNKWKVNASRRRLNLNFPVLHLENKIISSVDRT